MDYALNFDVDSLEKITQLILLARKRISKITVPQRNTFLTAIRRLAVFKTLHAQGSVWLQQQTEIITWHQFRQADIIDTIQAAIAIGDVPSALTILRGESHGS